MTRGNRTDRRGKGPALEYDDLIRLRCTLPQREAWQEAADDAGTTLSDWAREALDEIARRRGK
jgi:CHASE3 domain sensor protein